MGKNPWTGKTSLVTGGASGIGAALCQELAEQGASVIVSDLDLSKAQKLATSITERGGSAAAVGLDVTDGSAFAHTLEQIVRESGHVDVLFNNVGTLLYGEFFRMPPSELDRLVTINLKSLMVGSRLAYGHMVRQGGGTIVNMSSMMGLVPFPNMVAYAATKHAIVGLSRSLRVEGRAFGVKVIVVCPGLIQTNLFDGAEWYDGGSHDYLSAVPFKPLSPEKAARSILRGVSRNRAVVVFPFYVRLFWWLDRFCPPLSVAVWRKAVRDFRRRREPGF